MKEEKGLTDKLNELNSNGKFDYSDYTELFDLADNLQAENARLTEQLKNAVVLPRKVGDTIYEIRIGNRLEGNCILEHKVREILISTNVDTKTHYILIICGKDFNNYFWEEAYKDSWFATKPEAEARLAELNAKENL